jgi:translation initiation factor IF-2
MASPASVANLGSNGRPGPMPVAVARRAHWVTRISFTGFDGIRRWHYAPGRLCRCMVTTNLIEEKGVQFSARGAVSVKADDDNDVILKQTQKPLRPNEPPEGMKAASPPERKPAAASLEDREKVRESLDEVLEKAEKLEASSSGNAGAGNAGLRQSGVSTSTGPGKTAVEENGNLRKTKTLKSVWRKGNPVPTVQKVIREQPRTESRSSTHSTSAAKPSVPSPSKPAPPLLSKPSVVPPPRRPVQPDASKEKKGPILIDKFASKKPAVDPVVPEEMLDLKKPVRRMPTKAKVERHNKLSTPAGFRRRVSNDDRVDEDATDGRIAGVAVRKGRRWNKAKRRAARLEAMQAEEPVRVEILEVGVEGMLIEDLAYDLAVSESEILRFLSVRGVMLDNVQTLDKDLVKMVCMEYDVEVLESGPANVEEMAKKKEFLDEADLDKLEVRPPIVTIMGHVDHGKVTRLHIWELLSVL